MGDQPSPSELHSVDVVYDAPRADSTEPQSSTFRVAHAAADTPPLSNIDRLQSFASESEDLREALGRNGLDLCDEVERTLLSDDSDAPRTVNILVAEDEIFQQTLVSTMVDECRRRQPHIHYNVTIVDHAERVLTLVQQGASFFHIILLDILMPGTKGVAILRELRNLVGDAVAIVMLSAHSQEKLVRHCLQNGADDFLVKPLAVGTLMTLWRYTLGRACSAAPKPVAGRAAAAGTLGEGSVGGSSGSIDALSDPIGQSGRIPQVQLGTGSVGGTTSSVEISARSAEQSGPHASVHMAPLDSLSSCRSSLQRPSDRVDEWKASRPDSAPDDGMEDGGESVCRQQ